MLFVCIALSGCGVGDRDHEATSPDGTMYFRTSTTEGTLLVVRIFDQNGTILHEENTRASRVHRWSVDWVSDSKIMIKTSDIGSLALIRDDDGRWSRVNPLRRLAPDGAHVAYTYWNSYREKYLTLSILKADGDVDAASSVVEEYETEIAVANLEFCARWEGNNRIIVTADSGEYAWTRSPDGSWRQTNK